MLEKIRSELEEPDKQVLMDPWKSVLSYDLLLLTLTAYLQLKIISTLLKACETEVFVNKASISVLQESRRGIHNYADR